ncbi:MAG: hypothetical protein HUU55_23735 [Myxococcales bacterium]|nr:hypothetical protein [Myxococcales bacterium]
MPEQGRVGDRAQCPSDSHGCPSCAHPVIGPAVGGSPNVFVNSKSALRVSDPGVHAACCGANTWNATTGAPGVFFNGMKAHRKGDATKHCGGSGKLVQGSSDVFVGNQGGSGGPPHSVLSYQRRFALTYMDGRPVRRQRYKLTLAGGRTITGVTGEDGLTDVVESSEQEVVTLELIDGYFEV